MLGRPGVIDGLPAAVGLLVLAMKMMPHYRSTERAK